MNPVTLRLHATLLLVAVLLAGCTASAAPVAPTPSPVAVAAIGAPEPAAPQEAPPAAPIPTAVKLPTSTPTPTVPAPPTATPSGPTAIPTPSPRAAGTPPRVGLQVGHWKSNEMPEELARFRTSTGASWNGISEAELNLDIANRIKPLLEAQGVVVDILPATVPPSYDADAFIAIHADGNRSSGPRGWKLATPWRASQASKALMAAVGAAYGPATGLPEDVGGVTVNMRGYYAFSYRRYVHAIARTTPAIIVEMGFMTNARDREVLFGRPDTIARGVADGVLAYLAQRDPNDGAALLPPDFPAMRAKPEGATLRAAPRDNARVLLQITPEMRVVPFSLENGWYEAFVRGTEQRVIGFVRADQLEPTDEEIPLPTPTNP